MSIYVSNSVYLGDSALTLRKNRPLIGYHSVFRPGDVSAINMDFLSTPGNPSGVSQIWSPDTYTGINAQHDNTTSGPPSVIFSTPDGATSNYVGIVGHNLGTIGASFALQKAVTDDSGTIGWSNVFDPIFPVGDSPIFVHYDDFFSTACRIRIWTDDANQITPIKIKHVKIGEVLKLEEPMFIGMKPYGRDSESEGFNMTADNGNFLGQIITRRNRTWQIIQRNNSPNFIRQKIYPFIDHLNGFGNGSFNGPKSTFFGGWRPDAFPNEVIYGWKPLSQDAYPSVETPMGLMNWTASGKAIA